jgi:hypothetical protein
MKVKVCVLLASVLASTLMLPITTADAATGTVCKTENGTFLFSPTLPSKPNKTVNTVEYGKGTLGGCNNGVTGGTVTTVERIDHANCATGAPRASKRITTGKITWKPASKGTSTLRLTQVSTEVHGTFHGTVTAGRFKGTQLTIPLVWAKLEPAGACATAGLKIIVFKSTAAVHI